MKDSTGKNYPEADHFESSHPDYPIDKYLSLCDVEKFLDFKYFIQKVNERSEWSRGLIKEYNYNEHALNPEVEYFHPTITYDDRMVYIMENIVSLPDSELSLYNKIGNTIISHFYGARGIHSIATRDNNPKTAHVNFEIYHVDEKYRKFIRNNLFLAQQAKLPIYGTTELRTSLFGAANALEKSINGNKEAVHAGNIMDWVAWLGENGMFDRMINSNSAEETFSILTENSGIGSYYGYHCTTSNSVNPKLKWDNDSTFVRPGPGAQQALSMLFPTATSKQITSGDLVVWFRYNQKFFGFGDIIIHESARNVLDSVGKKILKVDQIEMTTYSSEVGLCQYGIFCKLRKDSKAADRRKVARVNNLDIESILEQAERKHFNTLNKVTLEDFF